MHDGHSSKNHQIGLYAPEKVLNEHTALYLTHSIRTLALTLVGIFLPLFIFSLSFTNPVFNTHPIINGLIWIFIYYLLRSLSTLICIFFGTDALFKTIHLKNAMIISFVFSLIEISIWFLAERSLFYIILAGLVAGIHVFFYWIPYHTFFVDKFSDTGKKYGNDTAKASFFVGIASSLSPFVGGLLISEFGFNSLFGVVAVLLFLASLPIFFILKERLHHDHHPFFVLKRFWGDRKFLPLTLTHLGNGIESIVFTICWSVLLFLALKDFTKIGLLNSSALVLSSFVTLLLGKYIDKAGGKRVHTVGVFINTFLNVPRLFFSAPPVLFYGLELVDKINSSLYSLPMDSKVYEKARINGAADSMLYREMVIHTGIIMVSVVIIGLLLVSGTWRWVFLFAMLGSALTYMIHFDKSGE